MITRQAIVNEARAWIGTPFHHGQALRGIGCDCIGLISGVAARFDLPEARAWRDDARFNGYGPIPRPDMLMRGCAEYLDKLSIDSATIGDVLLFAFKDEPMHFGIISQHYPRYVIHGFQRVGRVVENGVSANFWRVVRAFGIRGVQ